MFRRTKIFIKMKHQNMPIASVYLPMHRKIGEDKHIFLKIYFLMGLPQTNFIPHYLSYTFYYLYKHFTLIEMHAVMADFSKESIMVYVSI